MTIEIKHVLADGASYFPFTDSAGRFLRPGEVEALASTPDPTSAGRVRRLRAALVTNEAPRPPQPGQPWYRGRRLDLARVHCWPSIPVLHCDFLVGQLESIVWAADRLLGVLRLHPTILADVAWRAIAAGTIGDICAVLAVTVEKDEARADGGTVAWLNVDGRGVGCLPGAVVLDMWEEPDAGAPLPALSLTGVRAMLGPDVAEGAEDLVPPALRRLYEAELEAVLRATGEWCSP